jgi:hypothetical protein
MKPGPRDIKFEMLIAGEELTELKRHTWQMGEAYGLVSRIERYQGKRPIGLWRWDMECLIDVLDLVLHDPREYPSNDSRGYQILLRLRNRLLDRYRTTYD